MKKENKRWIKRMTASVLAAILFTASISTQATALAESSDIAFLNPVVQYSEDKKQAEITFDVNSVYPDVDKILTITSDKDGTIVYNNAIQTPMYKTAENGTYTFTVTYTQKQAVELPQEQPDEQQAQEKTDQDDSVAEQQTSQPETVAEHEQVPADQSVALQEPVTSEPQSSAAAVEESPQPEYVYVDKTEVIAVAVDGIAAEQNEPTASPPTTEQESEQEFDASADLQNDTMIQGEEKEDTSTDVGATPVDQIIDLTTAFNVSGRMSNYLKPSTDISPQAYSVYPNYFTLGNKELGYDFQTLAATTKYKMDLKRPFVIQGKIDYYGGAEGFAIVLHRGTDKDGNDFTVRNTTGSMGIYKGGSQSQHNAIYNGISMELDAYNNGGEIGKFGDDLVWGTHMAIQTTKDDGYVDEMKIAHTPLPATGEGKSFSVVWTPNWDGNTIKNYTLTFTYGDVTLTSDFDVNDPKIATMLMDENGEGGAAITFATGIGYLHGGKAVNFYVDKIAYTDFEFVQKTSAQPIVDGEPTERDFVMPGEEILITHEGWNSVDTPYSFTVKDAVNLNEMDIKSLRQRLPVTEIKVGTDPKNLQSYDKVFDENNPMTVKVPAQGGRYYIQYKVKIPKDAVDTGEKNQLKWSYWIGPKGITQYLASGTVDILARPGLYAQDADGKQITENQVLTQSGINGTSIVDALWKNLYGKASEDDAPMAITKGTGSPSRYLTMEYTYKKNGKTIEENEISGVGEDDVIALVITLKDNKTAATNRFARYIIASDKVSRPVNDGKGSVYYIISADKTFTKSETQLASYTAEKYSEQVIKEANVKILKTDNQGSVGYLGNENLTVDVANFINGTNKPNPEPYDLTINTKDIDGIKEPASLTLQQSVSANTWSYDTDGKTTVDGAVGFLVIPQRVVLAKDEGSNTVSGTGKIFFSDYSNATNVAYSVLVDRAFTLTGQQEKGTLNVISSVENQAQTMENEKLSVGTLTYGEKEKEVKFTVEEQADAIKRDLWTGTVTFYFERSTLNVSEITAPNA